MLNFEYQIFVVVFCRQAQWKKIKTNIRISIFDMSKSMTCRGHYSIIAELYFVKLYWLIMKKKGKWNCSFRKYFSFQTKRILLLFLMRSNLILFLLHYGRNFQHLSTIMRHFFPVKLVKYDLNILILYLINVVLTSLNNKWLLHLYCSIFHLF